MIWHIFISFYGLTQGPPQTPIIQPGVGASIPFNVALRASKIMKIIIKIYCIINCFLVEKLFYDIPLGPLKSGPGDFRIWTSPLISYVHVNNLKVNSGRVTEGWPMVNPTYD